MNADVPYVTEQCQTIRLKDGRDWLTCVDGTGSPTLLCLVDENGAALYIQDFTGQVKRLCIPKSLLK